MNRSRALLPHTKFAPARERLTRLIVLLPHTDEGAKWLTFFLDCTLGCTNCTAPTLRWSVYFYNYFYPLFVRKIESAYSILTIVDVNFNQRFN